VAKTYELRNNLTIIKNRNSGNKTSNLKKNVIEQVN